MSYKRKRIVGFSLLFLVLIINKIFLGGIYFDYLLEEIPIYLSILFVISFYLMIVPLIYRLIIKKRIEYKKGKKICLINSIILFILFSIPKLFFILKGNISTEIMSIDIVSFFKSLIINFFIIAIIYYFINMCFFVENKKR